MSKIHVLESDNNGNYQAIVHFAVPTNTNSAGKSWKNILLAEGKNTTIMTVGAGLKNITQTEYDNIIAGDILEISVSLLLESGGATTDSLDEMVDEKILEEKNRLKGIYKYYGYTQ